MTLYYKIIDPFVCVIHWHIDRAWAKTSLMYGHFSSSPGDRLFGSLSLKLSLVLGDQFLPIRLLVIITRCAGGSTYWR
jgi:hypothetical protein